MKFASAVAVLALAASAAALPQRPEANYAIADAQLTQEPNKQPNQEANQKPNQKPNQESNQPTNIEAQNDDSTSTTGENGELGVSPGDLKIAEGDKVNTEALEAFTKPSKQLHLTTRVIMTLADGRKDSRLLNTDKGLGEDPQSYPRDNFFDPSPHSGEALKDNVISMTLSGVDGNDLVVACAVYGRGIDPDDSTLYRAVNGEANAIDVPDGCHPINFRCKNVKEIPEITKGKPKQKSTAEKKAQDDVYGPVDTRPKPGNGQPNGQPNQGDVYGPVDTRPKPNNGQPNAQPNQANSQNVAANEKGGQKDSGNTRPETSGAEIARSLSSTELTFARR